MIQLYAIVVFVLVASGALLGSIAIVSIGIRREERALSLTRHSPSRLASGIRAANGFYSCGLHPDTDYRRPRDLRLPRPAGQRTTHRT
jgi:hypothetical protein